MAGTPYQSTTEHGPCSTGEDVCTLTGTMNFASADPAEFNRYLSEYDMCMRYKVRGMEGGIYFGYAGDENVTEAEIIAYIEATFVLPEKLYYTYGGYSAYDHIIRTREHIAESLDTGNYPVANCGTIITSLEYNGFGNWAVNSSRVVEFTYYEEVGNTDICPINSTLTNGICTPDEGYIRNPACLDCAEDCECYVPILYPPVSCTTSFRSDIFDCEPVDYVRCCDFVPKDFIAWADNWSSIEEN